MVTMIWVVGRN